MSTNSESGVVATAAMVPFAMLIGVPFGLYYAFADGFAIAKIWNWFVVPELALTAISWKLPAALMMILTVARKPNLAKHEEDKRPASLKVGIAIVAMLAPWTILLCAWVLR
jgi:hypothetical protein